MITSHVHLAAQGGGGGFKPYCLRLSLRQSAIGTYCVGLDINYYDGVFLCTLIFFFFLPAQGGGVLNPLNPPPPLDPPLGGVLTPNIGMYVPRQSKKNGKGSGTSSRSSVKMGVSGTSLSRFELENGGLRNELEPFWAWKCGVPERPLTRGAAEHLKMRISGTAANPRRCRTLENANLRNGPLTRGAADRLKMRISGTAAKLKEILKMMVSGTAKSAKKCKMVMLRNGFFW